MPIRKIADHSATCKNPDHNPPTHIYLEPGIWEHQCPQCGKKTIINIPVIENSAKYDDEEPTYITGTEDGI